MVLDRFLKYVFVFLLCIAICSACENRSGENNRQRTNIGKRYNSQSSSSAPQRNSVNNKGNARQEKSVDIKYSGSEIFRKCNTAVFTIYIFDGDSGFQGSGFFISPDGVAISNYHVFQGLSNGQEIIKLSNGDAYSISNVIAKSDDDDIIVFKVDGKGTRFNYLPQSTHNARVGDKVFAIGSPLGLENTFSSGEISQFRGNDIIQISVPIDHGSSGGALINEYGEVIGITSSGVERSGANLNFAIDINVLSKYIDL